MIKLELKLTNDWIEATWYTEADEVKTQVHCESFSGHAEHIAMLRSKLAEYGVETTVQDEALITECQAQFVYPTEEELAQEASKQMLQEANAYLASTDWVEPYLLRHELGLEVLPADSQKLVIAAKRAEYKLYIRGVN